MKKLFVMGQGLFFVLFPAVSSLTVSAYGNPIVTKLDESSSEFSIPPDIGISIPETQESFPIAGIIMWALAAVIVLAALIVIFSNSGRSGSSEQSVRRDRYKKKEKKSGKYSKYSEKKLR